MGLATWKSGSVQKADVTVARNYLFESEIGELNRIVTMWLDFAEDQARRRKEVFLKDWAEKLDAFLTFNERDVLEGPARFPGSRRIPMRKTSMSSLLPSGGHCWSPKGRSSMSVRLRMLPRHCRRRKRSKPPLAPSVSWGAAPCSK